jgi:hypothetical protein
MKISDFKKFYSQLSKDSREKAKLKICPICGKEQTSFCNSHSIPKFVLNNISVDGKLLQFSRVALDDFSRENHLIDIEKGLKNSCTFQLICRDCDSKIFSEYENSDNLQKRPSNKMMAEIELKNSAMMLSRRLYDRKFYETLEKTADNFDRGPLVDIQNCDIQDYALELKRTVRTVEGNQPTKYKLLYWKKYPYKMPLACQAPIALRETISGKKVNDLNNLDLDYHVEEMQLCVFPLEKETVIIMFYPEKFDKRYRLFRNEFLRLPEKQKLQYINYLIFAYTENLTLSPHIQSEILKNENLHALANENNGIPNMGFIPIGIGGELKEYFHPISWKEIPNVLDLKYAVE